MSTRISLEYCGMPGEGRSMTEAKQEAARRLTALVARLREAPEIIVFRHNAALLWSSPDGWETRLITDQDGKLRAGAQYGGTTSEPDRTTVSARAVLHLAQITWTTAEPDDAAFCAEAFPHARDDRPSLGLTMKRDLARWIVWQRAYSAARADGKTDSEAHHLATQIPH